jgi:quinol monooxygenase YgiN
VSEIVAVVVYRTHLGRTEEALEAFRRVIEATHSEQGARTCALAQSDEDPSVLVLIERWATQDAIDQHLAQPYVARFAQESEGLFSADPEVYFLKGLPFGDSVKRRL